MAPKQLYFDTVFAVIPDTFPAFFFVPNYDYDSTLQRVFFFIFLLD